MAIENRDLKVGTKLVARYRKVTHHAEVVAGEDGKLKYRLVDGREFKSPSSAGTAITNKSCNGWAFWSVVQSAEGMESTESVEAYPWANDCAEAAEDAVGPATTITDPATLASLGLAAPIEEQAEAPAQFRRVPNQRGVPEGQVRLYCDTCKKSFMTAADQQPQACPAGHKPAEAQQEVAKS